MSQSRTFWTLGKSGIISALFLCVLFASLVSAQEVREDTVSIVRAEVVSATEPALDTEPSVGTKGYRQDLRVLIREGELTGSTVSFTNDYVMLGAGEMMYLSVRRDPYTDTITYSVADPYRVPVLGGLFILFLCVCAGVGRWQGVRGVLSLLLSVLCLYGILLPMIEAGRNPVIASLLVAACIVIIGSYVTHGISRTTSAAVIGMIVTIALTGVATQFILQWARITGYAAEEAVYLSLNSEGALSLVGLLMGGMLIGLLGVLYDSAIGQAVAVEELYRSGQASGVVHPPKYIFARAMRIGREHIGALVNTLAIAYVGASLPLILLVSQASTAPLLVTLNSEVFATEIIRILVGSIGVIATVPITTYVAVWWLRGVSFTHERAHTHRH